MLLSALFVLQFGAKTVLRGAKKLNYFLNVQLNFKAFTKLKMFFNPYSENAFHRDVKNYLKIVFSSRNDGKIKSRDRYKVCDQAAAAAGGSHKLQ